MTEKSRLEFQCLLFSVIIYFKDSFGHPNFFAQILVIIGTKIAVTTTDAAICVVTIA